MPRPALPPTPNSADFKGKDGMAFQSSLEGSFALPPPALTSKRSSTMSSFPPPSSPESTRLEQNSSRRRASTSQSLPGKDDFTLPPPPTRSRKIIQMKPREKDLEENSNSSNTKARRNSKSTVTTAVESPKRKTPSSSSAAGRKMARKTAHSLIERRRRSKMNEEFGVLKDMIPACKDQEMHKLAILQASIDYLRYLEQCVQDLKKASTSPNTHPHLAHPLNNPPPLRPSSAGDITMEDSPPLSTPGPTSSPSHSQLTSPTGYSAHETPPALISPIYAASAVSDTIISPALLPQQRHGDGPDLDREATHALMMLTNDRRGTTRGLSVKDLLSA